MKRKPSKQQNRIRIIGGTHRSRLITFPSIQGLRPSTDATRETVFNWLNPVLAGAHCLDLFAGSGAFGFEALSRGAKSATLVDNHSQVLEHLKYHADSLKLPQAQIIYARLPDFLEKSAPTPYDIVFLDPPFHQVLLEKTCHALAQGGWLKAEAWIYIEHEKSLTKITWPTDWHLQKEKFAQQSRSALYQWAMAPLVIENPASSLTNRV